LGRGERRGEGKGSIVIQRVKGVDEDESAARGVLNEATRIIMKDVSVVLITTSPRSPFCACCCTVAVRIKGLDLFIRG
jgi:hypothetical protein